MNERFRLVAPTNEEYDQLKAAIERAKAQGDGIVYAEKVIDLASLMERQLQVETGSKYGDLYHSYQEWAYRARVDLINRRQEVERILSQGGDFEFRSNTLTNQRTPHLPDWSGNTHIVSSDMADAVGGFVAGRGRPYMQAYIVQGIGNPLYTGGERAYYSAYQVLTKVLGFKP